MTCSANQSCAEAATGGPTYCMRRSWTEETEVELFRKKTPGQGYPRRFESKQLDLFFFAHENILRSIQKVLCSNKGEKYFQLQPNLLQDNDKVSDIVRL